jgi:hypothetical protein
MTNPDTRPVYKDFSEMPIEVLQELCRALDEISRKAAAKAAKVRRKAS